MPTPLPSPNGTNLERLYITRGPMAHDAAPDDSRAMFEMFLAKLSPEEKGVLRSMLDGDDASGSSSANDRARDHARGLQISPDERARIRLMVDAFGERVSGSSSTAARAAYEARFPNANRLK